ncbi:MAG: hypothetical protein LC772_05955, partial [Chloroflexi bacterium]|nr:hypothetical protein [Chloroflexota bacterium]
MELLWDGKYDADGRRVEPSRIAYPFRTTAVFGESVSGDAGGDGPEGGSHPHAGWRNRLILGDNRYVLPSLLPEFAGKVNLAYLDPPFATGSAFSLNSRGQDGQRPQAAFRDNWGRDLGHYLQWLTQQLILVRELLHETGSLYLHLDWRAVAYVRAAADEVFGPTFRSCIIWAYGGRGAKSAAGQFPRNHDQILVYSRGPHFTYHPVTREKRTPLS